MISLVQAILLAFTAAAVLVLLYGLKRAIILENKILNLEERILRLEEKIEKTNENLEKLLEKSKEQD